ncbi:MAG: hypothetical protein KF678_04345 [Phycisphaeraceae bacterium]|nr:hypothetical protein [Phycisphaeraceae bacterium]
MARTIRYQSRLIAAAGLAACASAFGQASPDPSAEIPWRLDSGYLPEKVSGSSVGVEASAVWTRRLEAFGAPWMRVKFGADTHLSGTNRHQGGSFITITSVRDGATQYFDSTSLAEWGNHSAYFNGDAVTVTLHAVPGLELNRVVVESLIVGTALGGPDTICGTTDDRVPDNDPRVGRVTTGCTGWLITRNQAANEYLTAGHCISNGQNGVLMQFNVPPATAGGVFVAPPVEFQFPVQAASIQQFDSGAVGDEYARYNTNNNSNTGLPARVAQGRSAYLLAGAAPASGTAPTTVRGHGIVNDQAGIPAVPVQWQRINKVDTGAYAGRVGNRINYLADTDNANSGSPVTQFIGSPIAIEQAIGIHTDGFCPGTFNSGTAIDHAGLQGALSAPAGTPFPFDTSVYKALFTTSASDNGGSDGGSIFFDVATGTSSIEVNYLLLNINRNAATNNGTATEDDDFFNFTVYIRPGTARGFETNILNWTQVATGAGMPRPENSYTLGALRNTFTLNGSQSYGVAIVFDNGAGHAYTNGTGSNEIYSNADLTITGVSASNTAFGTNISPRVFNGALGYRLNSSSGQCLETLFAQNNNGSNGGMVYMDVRPGALPVTVTGLTTNVEGTGGLNCNVTVYRKVGTSVGFETNAGAWTQVATGTGTSSAVNTPTGFGLDTPFTLNANTTYGLAIRLQTSGAVEGHAYTNGNGLNQSYSDGRLEVTLGSASNTPFGTNFSPRIWNGSLCYGVNLAVCANTLVDQRPPNPQFAGFNSVPGGQEEADNFSSASNLSITGGTFWGSYAASPTAPLNQDLVVRIFSNNAGLPGTLLATRTIADVALNDTGLFMLGGFNKPIYQYNVTFAPIALPPGSYWVSVLGNEPGYTWAWARTNGTPAAHAVRQGAGAWSTSAGDFAFVLCGTSTPVSCYANCDGSTGNPLLTANDFQCFLNKYAANDTYANCDGSTGNPLLTANDFQCFLNKFAAGCS